MSGEVAEHFQKSPVRLPDFSKIFCEVTGLSGKKPERLPDFSKNVL
jgi:hypothetical protein